MSDEEFRKLCNIYGFAPSRALRELIDCVRAQAALSEPVPVAWMHIPYPGSGLRQMVSLIQNREPSLYAASVPLFLKEQL